MKRTLLLLAIIAVFCFVPVVKVSYPVVVDISTVEEYTTTEPYTVQQEVRTPSITYSQQAEWVDDGSWNYAKNYVAFTVEEYMDVFQSVTPGRWVIRQYPTTSYTSDTVTMVRYREITKTRTVLQPTIMYEWKRVPLIQGFSWK